MQIDLKMTILTLLSIFSLLLTGCDEAVEGNPDFWANSYFGQTSPYPMGTLNPVKKEYKYSMPWTVVQTKDKGYLFGGLLRTFEESNAMLFKLNSEGVVEKGFVVHDGTKVGQDRQSGVITSVLDNGDGYIIAGWVSRDSSSNIIKSNTCMWLMKLNYSGNIIWNTAHGLTSYYEDKASDADSDVFMNGLVYSMAKTNDGGFILGGKHLAKINSQGILEWSKTNIKGIIKDIKTTSDSGFIFTAYTDQYTSNTITKTDSMGNIAWSREYHIDKLNSGFSAVEPISDTNGETTGFILGGQVIYPEARNSDCLLVCLDTQGNLLWDYTYNGVLYDAENMIFSEENISSVITANDGNLLIGISSESFQEELNMKDPIVVKIDKNGEIIWEKAYDVFGERISKLAPTEKGFVFTSDLNGGGDWQSLVATCPENGNIPDHGSDLIIKDIQFMIDSPDSFLTDTINETILTDSDLVSVTLKSTLKEVTTERVRR